MRRDYPKRSEGLLRARSASRSNFTQWAIVCVLILSVFCLSYCGNNWLDVEPEVEFTRIAIDIDGTGVIEGIALGQVHAILLGIDTYDKSKMAAITDITRYTKAGLVTWRYTVPAGKLEQGNYYTIFVCAASESDYSALRSWTIPLDGDEYSHDFDVDISIPSSEPSSSEEPPVNVSSANTDTNVNYDFDGSIEALRNDITHDETNPDGLNRTITGIVHAVNRPGCFWLQDRTAGIYIYIEKGNDDNPSLGDKVTLTAKKGYRFREVKEVVEYTGYTKVSSGNPVYRQNTVQNGAPTAAKQGQAWEVPSVVVSSSWTNKATITVAGIQFYNESGLTIPAGTYKIQGPVSQYRETVQIAVYDKMYTDLNAIKSSAASTASSISSTGGGTPGPDPNPAGSWAQDAAKPANLRPFNNYYDLCYGKTGTALKQALYDRIKGHTAGSYAGLYSIYAVADITPDGKVWDIYSDRDGTGMSRPYTYSHVKGDQCGNYSKEGDCYNREHMIPQSKFGEASPMVCDAHHVLPTDGKVNGMRSNYPHAMVSSARFTSMNGTKVGTSATSGVTGDVCEPINVYKGDTARIYMYFSLRYWGNNTVKSWEAMNQGATLKPWAQTLFRQWHTLDPVSEKERVRNNGVQQFQKNRNPFIDYPELAELISFTD